MTAAPVLVVFACPRCETSVRAVASARVEHRCPRNNNRVTVLEAKP